MAIQANRRHPARIAPESTYRFLLHAAVLVIALAFTAAAFVA